MGPRPIKFQPLPGQYVMVRVPEISNVEWHPFTLSAVGSDGGEPPELHVKAEGAGSWTRALAAKNGARLEVQVTGPYGAGVCAPDGTETLVMVAGGIGVTPCIALLRDLLEKAEAMERGEGRGGGFERVVFVWASRETKLFDMFQDLFVRSLDTDLVDVLLFDTRGGGGPGNPNGADEGGRGGMMNCGRPDIDKILAEVGERAHVFSCGPAPLVAAVKNVAANRGLSFHTETFEL
jgi:NAD(P)H-flavin reductase